MNRYLFDMEKTALATIIPKRPQLCRDFSGYSYESEIDDQFDHGIVVLSYEGIEEVYHDLAVEFSKFAIALDLTENEITDLSFLRTFHKLQSLVLDKNRHMEPRSMPTMKSLQILWLNGCNIPDISKWVDVIRVRCPKLRCLSLINNPGARSLINLSTSHENEEYRAYVAGRLKNLEYLDEAPITRSSLARLTSGQFLARLFHFKGNGDSNRDSNVSSSEVVSSMGDDSNLSHFTVQEEEKQPWRFQFTH